MNSPVLTLSEVAKTYGDVLALRKTSLTLVPGELVVLTGPSGSGKSTLLMIAGGWETPDSGGEVTPHPPLPDRPMSAMSWQDVGFVPQSISLLDELTIADNLGFARRPRGSEDLDELLEAFDLTKFANRTPGEVSRGEQQRTAVARALVGNAMLVLADEPTSHQDRGRAAMVLANLRQAADRGAAVVIASHDPESHAFADREINLGTG